MSDESEDAEEVSIWTDVHRNALKEADFLLRKYFDSFLLCVQVVSHDTHKETERYAFAGGKMTAIGLGQTFVNGMTKDDTWLPGNDTLSN